MIILNVVTLIECGILENIVLKSIKNGKIARTPPPRRRNSSYLERDGE